MGKTLKEFAQDLRNSKNKVQLIYAFNGTGKTRLSREFKRLIEEDSNQESDRKKIIYYNAYTEDLFFWDNNRDSDEVIYTLKIQENSFIKWVLKDEGKENVVTKYFQQCVNKKLTPNFQEDFTEVTFSLEGGNDESLKNIKISKGEESCFIWSIFYVLIEQVIAELKTAEIDKRSTDKYNDLEYIFIDDPVSSLDEDHLIGLAVDLAALINKSQQLKFIVTTHNILFYNVFYNELQSKCGKLLKCNEDGTFELVDKQGDSNRSFSYHLFLKKELEDAIKQKNIQKYHFMFLRNLYEKTASFLGYQRWSVLLPGKSDSLSDKENPTDENNPYLSRIMNLTSHSTLSNEQIAEPSPKEKKMIEFLLNHLNETYHFFIDESSEEKK